MNSIPLYEYTTFCLSVHYFHFWLIWAILVWRSVYKFLYGHIFISTGFIPRNGIAESNVNSVLNFLKNCQTVFQSGCTILYFHKQCVSSDLSTSLLMLVIIWLYYSHLIWYEVIYHHGFDLQSLMTSDVEHLFNVLISHLSFLEKCPFRSFAHF